MSTVSFSGLASGLDTESIVESLMEVESIPLTELEDKQEYLESKLDVYTEFNGLLQDFYAALSGLNSESDLNSFEVTNSGEEYFSISTNSLAEEGSYSVEVVSLAKQQKDVSTNYIETTSTSISGSLQIGEETLDYSDTTLSDLVSQINSGEYGVTASMINDGSGSGYRLMLTAETAGEAITIVGTGDITLDTETDGHTQEGTEAHVIVDGVDYYGSSNRLTNAIKGATLTLNTESDNGASGVTIASDAEEVIITQLEEMVSVYNSINTYIDEISDSDSALANTMKSVQRRLKNYLTSSSLLELGVSSDWSTGDLSLDSSTLRAAYAEDSEAVTTALLGDDDTEGILQRIDTYMDEQLDKTTGFLVTKETSIEKQISRLDDSIESMELRLEKRQELLESQFAALETLMSELNSQSDFLTSFFDSYSAS